MPGIMPPKPPMPPFPPFFIILRMFRGILPPENCFVMVCSMSNCFSRRFTSTTWVPEPAAMRFFRLEFRTLGFSRS